MTEMSPGTRRRRRVSVPAIVLTGVALLLAGCGGGDDDGAAVELTPVSRSPTPTTSAPTPTETSSPTPTPSPSASPITDEELPGEPIDRARAGEGYAVVGVAHDDTLNVRAIPGTAGEVIGELDPTADGVHATGRGRALSSSVWFEVEIDSGTGWASAAFLALPAGTVDITSEVVDQIGETPRAETMLDLGMIVAETRASEEPPSEVVVTVAPTVGDLGEVTLDVIGLGDDAVVGERLHVFGTPEDSGEGFTLRSVEATWLCGRGVDGDLCV